MSFLTRLLSLLPSFSLLPPPAPLPVPVLPLTSILRLLARASADLLLLTPNTVLQAQLFLFYSYPGGQKLPPSCPGCCSSKWTFQKPHTSLPLSGRALGSAFMLRKGRAGQYTGTELESRPWDGEAESPLCLGATGRGSWGQGLSFSRGHLEGLLYGLRRGRRDKNQNWYYLF